MAYAILRFAKRKAGGVAATERHNERRKDDYKSNPDIDTDASPDNYRFIKAPPESYTKAISARIAAEGCRTRKDSVTMVECLITASPEFLEGMNRKEEQDFFSRATRFIGEKVGADNIIAACVHKDEKTPHLHLCFVPITKDGRLAAKSILGSPKDISRWQTEFHEFMKENYPELERGKPVRETGRKHIPLWLFKSALELDEQFKDVSQALADYQHHTYDDERHDKALATLAAWSLEAGRFMGKLQRSDYLSDKADAAEFTTKAVEYLKSKGIQDTAHELDLAWVLRDLTRRVKKQQALLDRIPDDIKHDIQRQIRRDSNQRGR